MNTCLTKAIAFPEVSGCLVENPECGYAHTFGFSYVCCHPDHKEFRTHIVGTLTRDDAVERYDALRRKRREEFTAHLDETSRNYFCQQPGGFFDKPLAAMELNGHQK